MVLAPQTAGARDCRPRSVDSVRVGGRRWRAWAFDRSTGILEVANLTDANADPANPGRVSVCLALNGQGSCGVTHGFCNATAAGGAVSTCSVMAVDAGGGCCPVSQPPPFAAPERPAGSDFTFGLNLQLNRSSPDYDCDALAARSARNAFYRRITGAYASALGLQGAAVAVLQGRCTRADVLQLNLVLQGGGPAQWSAALLRGPAILSRVAADTGAELQGVLLGPLPALQPTPAPAPALEPARAAPPPLAAFQPASAPAAAPHLPPLPEADGANSPPPAAAVTPTLTPKPRAAQP
ncbi:hypothetical protein GPECTOR_1g900 [Gonium pectorale]|uniref:Pherophorin domain-containing protein n=1 Tax=Gonium pectorale TaxID=33097 RepID=A0A150H4E1_GONPE|nr:hypothetical protein GPECTOR_1g900 [Gonium pectorale]|eukprot:KXZ56997.1 hypothetical protein GPECTOR_1g900 [Gonium pectorale]